MDSMYEAHVVPINILYLSPRFWILYGFPFVGSFWIVVVFVLLCITLCPF